MEIELLPGKVRVFEIELIGGSATGQVIYDSAVIDNDLLVISAL